jgi:hypothetical protein
VVVLKKSGAGKKLMVSVAEFVLEQPLSSTTVRIAVKTLGEVVYVCVVIGPEVVVVFPSPKSHWYEFIELPELAEDADASKETKKEPGESAVGAQILVEDALIDAIGLLHGIKQEIFASHPG